MCVKTVTLSFGLADILCLNTMQSNKDLKRKCEPRLSKPKYKIEKSREKRNNENRRHRGSTTKNKNTCLHVRCVCTYVELAQKGEF